MINNTLNIVDFNDYRQYLIALFKKNHASAIELSYREFLTNLTEDIVDIK